MRKMTIELQPGDLIKSPLGGVPRFILGSLVRNDEFRLVVDIESREPFKDSLTIVWIISPLGTISSGSYGKSVTWEVIE